MVGFDAEVQAQLIKLVSIGLCSNTLGQLATGLMVQPPQPGDASYDVCALPRLTRRAQRLATLRPMPTVPTDTACGAVVWR